MLKKDVVSGIKGYVAIRCLDQDGNVIWEKQSHNLITFGIRDVLGELLVQNFVTGARSTSDLKIASIRMGTSDASPARGQIGLQSTAVVFKALTAPNVSRTSAGIYVYNVTMETGEGNGTTFTEVGLFTSDGTMIARQVHPPFTKDISQTIQYTWTQVFA